MAVSEDVQIDLFIIDVMTPKMSGMELLKKLNVRESLLEVIVTTGKRDADVAGEALKLGAYGVLRKPFTRSELLTYVEYALASAAAKKRQIANP
jgi:DNA-binding NtrC family response regulator